MSTLTPRRLNQATMIPARKQGVEFPQVSRHQNVPDGRLEQGAAKGATYLLMHPQSCQQVITSHLAAARLGTPGCVLASARQATVELAQNGSPGKGCSSGGRLYPMAAGPTACPKPVRPCPHG